MLETKQPSRSHRKATPQQRLISGQQASEITGLPYTTIRDLHFKGVLAIVRFPGSRRWWIRREDLDQLIERSVERVRA